MTTSREELFGSHYSQRSVHRALLEGLGHNLVVGAEFRRPGGRYSRVTKAVASLALAGAGTFVGDSLHAQYDASHTEAAIIQVEVANSKMDSDSAINVSAGFGLRNSYSIANTIKNFSAEGHVWSTMYDNRGVNPANISHLLLERAQVQGVKNLALWGDSMGGTVSLEMAVAIQKSDQDISVPYIVLENTPSSLEAVRQEQRDNAQLLLSSTGIPLIAYSRIAQFALEVGARHEQYLDDSFDRIAFAETAAAVRSKINDPETPSMALMSSQFSTIITSNVERSIAELGKSEEYGKNKPVLVLIRPESDASDRVVNSDIMESQYRRYALESGLRLVVITMPGISHGDPTMNQVQYAEIVPVIVSKIEETLRRDDVADSYIDETVDYR